MPSMPVSKASTQISVGELGRGRVGLGSRPRRCDSRHCCGKSVSDCFLHDPLGEFSTLPRSSLQLSLLPVSNSTPPTVFRLLVVVTNAVSSVPNLMILLFLCCEQAVNLFVLVRVLFHPCLVVRCQRLCWNFSFGTLRHPSYLLQASPKAYAGLFS